MFDDFEEFGILPHLVETDYEYGLTEKDVEKAKKLLS